jgi:hypothetical protein
MMQGGQIRPLRVSPERGYTIGSRLENGSRRAARMRDG